MTFREGLIRGRSHIVFIAGLLAASALVLTLERWDVAAGAAAGPAAAPAIPLSADRPAPRPAPLSAEQRRQAETAWAYFEANLRDTGLVDSVAGYAGTTLWDTGSYLLALIAAERLGLIEAADFDARMAKALDALARLPLVPEGLPNKAYDTRNLAMTDYDLNPAPAGIGWSALDIGRALVPLTAVMRDYPAHNPAARAVLARWRLDRVVGADGLLYGGAPGAGGNTLVQEGRLGYEEYAARAFALLGYDVAPAQRLADWLEWHDVYGVRVASDSRRAESFGAHVHTTSEPFILAGLEFGLGAEFGELGYRVFQAQRRRFEETGRLTAVSEDHLDRAPRFVYGTVVANGEPWAVVTPDGKPAEPFRLLSTKTAFAFAALFPSPYSDRLREAAAGLAAPQGGWYAGRYEATGETNAVLAANTNAVVLEALHFQAHGPLLAPRAAP